MSWIRTSLLAVAAVVAALAAASPASAATCAAGAGWPAAQQSMAAEVVTLVNQHRASIGLKPLAVSPTLTAAATFKSRHMAQFGYFAHDDAAPASQTFAQRIAACGYPANAGAGENIAMGQRTAAEVMAGWLASPGHKANIERASFAAIGVGVARSASGALYWTQDFGSVVDAGTVPAPAPAPAPADGPLLRAVTLRGHRLTVTLSGAATLRVRVAQSRPTTWNVRRAGTYRIRLPRVPATYVVTVSATAGTHTETRRVRLARG